MATQTIRVERQIVISSQRFDRVLATLESQVGRPDKARFMRDMAGARTMVDLERVVQAAAGTSGLIEMARFDPGNVVRQPAAPHRIASDFLSAIHSS